MTRPDNLTAVTIADLNRYFDQAISYRYGEKPTSDEFCGLYFHGHARPFTLAEHDIPIRTFRYFSQYSYPIYLFYNEAAGGEIEELLRRYDNIVVVPIKVMRSIRDYDVFVIYEMFEKISINNTLTFHWDGYLLNPGWEAYVLEHDFDYIGAPWCRHAGEDGNLYLPGQETRHPIRRRTAVGNGGFCFRKRDKCREVAAVVDRRALNWRYSNGLNLPDDVFFSYFGFGLEIFRPYDVSLAYRWALEPMGSWETFGFHRTQPLVDEIQRRASPPA